MVCIIIERHIAEGFASYFDKMSQQVLSEATVQQGFVSGSSFHNSYDENHRVVIAKYDSIQDWQRWHSSDERQQIMANLLPMLQSDEKITVLEH
ncbi:MAG: antibiotic biosynthesis monooxygenase [Oceanospirillaceae bacterium]|nr:antibiotic biosynthesis monooxygenase [Oceanospirillaceae bacterium]